jgi:hypothetical protein
MRFKFSLLIFLSFAIHISAQEKDTKYITEASAIDASFKNNHFFSNEKLPFKNILVYNYRYDTSKIAYVKEGIESSGYSSVQLKKGWTSELNKYFANNLDPAASLSLFIFIRTFWINEGLPDKLNNKVVATNEWLARKKGGYCTAALDVFAGIDTTLYALFKIEDFFPGFYSFDLNHLKEWFYSPFDSIAHRIQNENIPELISRKRKLNMNDVRSFYTKRFDVSVMKTCLKKGVFKTFDDFRNNNPLEGDFKLTNAITDELYIISKSKEELILDYWGVFDGKNLFIRAGFNVFPAVRVQNTFEIYGAKYITNIYNNPRQGDLIRTNKMRLFKSILQLNMDTGRFY